jgi:hypothetical protein
MAVASDSSNWAYTFHLDVGRFNTPIIHVFHLKGAAGTNMLSAICIDSPQSGKPGFTADISIRA